MKTKWFIFVIIFFIFTVGPAVMPQAHAQSSHTLVGEWLMKSTPIDGKVASPRGTTLGFPDRDMVFAEDGDLRTGMVLREDVGPDVRPLGSWRVEGERFSAAFELWCPDTSGPCGSVIMRGQFLDDDSVKGTMTVFFDTADPSQQAGYDTWVFSFRGNRKAEGSSH